jgi:hypothetical protein
MLFPLAPLAAVAVAPGTIVTLVVVLAPALAFPLLALPVPEAVPLLALTVPVVVFVAAPTLKEFPNSTLSPAFFTASTALKFDLVAPALLSVDRNIMHMRAEPPIRRGWLQTCLQPLPGWSR